LLDSLAAQSLPQDRFEVIVVDDGSTDDMAELAGLIYPFDFTYVFQANQGDAAARNTGAGRAEGNCLLFLDDDILLHPRYLECVLETQAERPDRIVVGRDIPWLGETHPLRDPAANPIDFDPQPAVEAIPFVEVCSNNMSILREAYLRAGPMENLGFPGSSIWCDVEFAYRSHLQGFEFYRDNRAICWHRDHVLANLDSRRKRAWDSGFRAVTLFKKHPVLVKFLPMFADKTPLDMRRDSPGVILRKLLRRVSASRAGLGLMEGIANRMPVRWRASRLNRALHRWLIGAAVYRGFSRGLWVERHADPN
jgi:glycosyltransferase involved in cell wall biosynthesis